MDEGFSDSINWICSISRLEDMSKQLAMMKTFYKVLIPSIILIWTVRADCDSPPTIPNAASNITGSPPYPEDTVVRYDCNLGYTTAGTSRYYTCSNTEWTGGNIQCDIIYCSYVETPENGQVINTPTNEVGSSIKFACDEGHDMSGSDVMLCRTDGEWSPSTPPLCTAKDCGDFGSIQYASLFQDNSEIERNYYGSVVEVTCQGGRVLSGPPRVNCEADGQWGQRPTCEVLQCPQYPNINASCISSSQLLGDFYFILCKEDISTRTGPNAAECINGAWDSLEMACYCDCNIPDLNTSLISISNLNSHGNLLHEATLQWTCNTGSSRYQVDYVICTDGKLRVIKEGEEVAFTNSPSPSDNNVLVLAKLCASPTTPDSSVDESTQKQTTVMLNTVSQGLVSSVSVHCDSPPTIPNAASNITGSPPYPEDTVVRYDCNLGYTTTGTSRYYTCSNTEWTGGNIQCDIIHCSYVETPENGRVINTPTNEVGSSIKFACDEGHDMSGSDVMLCRTDGEWSPSTPPLCTAKDCGDFGSIQYASLFQDNSEIERNYYGSVVEVTCQGGRVLSGPPRVNCEADGQWGQRPTCEVLVKTWTGKNSMNSATSFKTSPMSVCIIFFIIRYTCLHN